MTPDAARAILSAPSGHDDATIRAAAALLLAQGGAQDTATARRFARFGLPGKPQDTDP